MKSLKLTLISLATNMEATKTKYTYEDFVAIANQSFRQHNKKRWSFVKRKNHHEHLYYYNEYLWIDSRKLSTNETVMIFDEIIADRDAFKALVGTLLESAIHEHDRR